MTFVNVQPFHYISAGSVPDVVLSKLVEQLSQNSQPPPPVHKLVSSPSRWNWSKDDQDDSLKSFTPHPSLWPQLSMIMMGLFKRFSQYPPLWTHLNHQWSWWIVLEEKFFPDQPHDPLCRQINTRLGFEHARCSSKSSHRHCRFPCCVFHICNLVVMKHKYT